jgi:hypothetical protein
MNIEILELEVTSVQALDHRVARLLAEERVALLRADAERGTSRGGSARQRVGLALVGLGFRIAGPRVMPRERLSSVQT